MLLEVSGVARELEAVALELPPAACRQPRVKHSLGLRSKTKLSKGRTNRPISLEQERQVRSMGQSLFGRALEDPGGVKVHSCHCTFLKAGIRKENL